MGIWAARSCLAALAVVGLSTSACAPPESSASSPAEKRGEEAGQQSSLGGGESASVPGSGGEAPPDESEGMATIPKGEFVFGASERQFQVYLRQSTLRFSGMEERMRARFSMPQQSIELEEFSIDEFEVSNADFRSFLQATGFRPENRQNFLKHWEGKSAPPEWAADFPVVWVSPEDAEAYCEWRSARLPSEQEWEKAARGSDGRYFPWGNKGPSPTETAVFAAEQSELVGNRPGDASPYEVYDMGGNVAEWTSNRQTFEGRPHAVYKGGSFRESAREMLTYNRRLLQLPWPRAEHIGFRCAKSAQ